jgi:hypothetical protein
VMKITKIFNDEDTHHCCGVIFFSELNCLLPFIVAVLRNLS